MENESTYIEKFLQPYTHYYKTCVKQGYEVPVVDELCKCRT